MQGCQCLSCILPAQRAKHLQRAGDGHLLRPKLQCSNQGPCEDPQAMQLTEVSRCWKGIKCIRQLKSPASLARRCLPVPWRPD